jgi:hypothetical protein
VDCETPVSFAMSVIVGRRCVDFFIVSGREKAAALSLRCAETFLRCSRRYH